MKIIKRYFIKLIFWDGSINVMLISYFLDRHNDIFSNILSPADNETNVSTFCLQQTMKPMCLPSFQAHKVRSLFGLSACNHSTSSVLPSGKLPLVPFQIFHVVFSQTISRFSGPMLIILPKNKNIFSSQVAFSVVAFSGQAVLVLFGVPLSNEKKEEKHFLEIWRNHGELLRLKSCSSFYHIARWFSQASILLGSLIFTPLLTQSFLKIRRHISDFCEISATRCYTLQTCGRCPEI